MPKITSEQFKVFETAVHKWIDVFGLHDYEIHIRHVMITSDAVANCFVNEEAMCVTIKLNKKLHYNIPNNELDEAALHEVLEILLWDICSFAPENHVKFQLDKAAHSVIQRVINAFKRGVIQLKPEGYIVDKADWKMVTVSVPDIPAIDLEGRENV